MSVLEMLQKQIQTDEEAVQYLEKIRWNGKAECPYCNHKQVYPHKSKDRAIRRWQCKACRKTFSATVGTIFHGTRISLKDWFIALDWIFTTNGSISSYTLSNILDIRQPTVWRMAHKIRTALNEDTAQSQLLYDLAGVKERYIDYKKYKKMMPKHKSKTDILAAIIRKSRLP